MRRKLLVLLASLSLIVGVSPVEAAKREATTKKPVSHKSAKKTHKAQKKLVAARSTKPVKRVALNEDPAQLAIRSSAALVIDQSSNRVVIEKQPDAVLPIASISKLMTAMVVLDAGLDMHEVISIGAEGHRRPEGDALAPAGGDDDDP